jgi:uncharacterized protein (DUF1778 family)
MTTTSHEAETRQLEADNRPGGNRRSPETTPRSKQVFVRLSEGEYGDLAVAAQRAQLTTTSFVAEAALAAARGQAAPSDPAASITRAELAELQRELFAARAEVARVGNNLNQAAKILNSPGRVPTWLDEAVAHCDATLAHIDDVASEVDRQLQ